MFFFKRMFKVSHGLMNPREQWQQHSNEPTAEFTEIKAQNRISVF